MNLVYRSQDPPKQKPSTFYPGQYDDSFEREREHPFFRASP